MLALYSDGQSRSGFDPFSGCNNLIDLGPEDLCRLFRDGDRDAGPLVALLVLKKTLVFCVILCVVRFVWTWPLSSPGRSFAGVPVEESPFAVVAVVALGSVGVVGVHGAGFVDLLPSLVSRYRSRGFKSAATSIK